MENNSEAKISKKELKLKLNPLYVAPKPIKIKNLSTDYKDEKCVTPEIKAEVEIHQILTKSPNVSKKESTCKFELSENFSCSPPLRTTNPLIEDYQFRKRKTSNVDEVDEIRIFGFSPPPQLSH
jgi:hypothetical protein